MEKPKTPSKRERLKNPVQAVFGGFMKKVNLTAKVGLAINLLAMLLYMYGLRNGFFRDVNSEMMAGLLLAGFLLCLTGLAMLDRGNPAGGFVGAAGSAFFLPAGLVCMVGCFQTRDKLRFASHAASAPTRLAARETPLAAYEFRNLHLPGIQTMVLGTGMGCAFLMDEVVIAGAWFGFLLAALGLAITVRSKDREQWKVYALFRDRLECPPGAWSEPVAIPYAHILAVDLYWHKARLFIRRPGGKEKIMLRFGNIPDDKRDEAREIFANKMRELGVLHEVD